MTKTKMNFLFPFFLLILCLLYPSVCMEGAKNGLSISLDLAFPSLFPSLVLSGMITETLGGKGGKKAFFIPFIIGLFCGFPVGAKGVCDLYKKGKISKKDSEDLLFFCNNAGPSFLIGLLGTTLFSDYKKGLFLFLMQGMISTLLFLVFLKKRNEKEEKKEVKDFPSPPSFFHIFTKSLHGAIFSFLYIISCIVFFSFFTSLIFRLFPLSQKLQAILSLFMELTSGCTKAAISLRKYAFPLCAFGCGFGGLSVHLQTLGLLEEAGLCSKKHFVGKLFFAVCMFFGAFFFQKLL